MRGALLIVATLALVGCGLGEEKPAARPDVFEFKAAVVVTPEKPVPGRRVSLNVELVSACNKKVETDIVMRVVDSAGTRVMYEQTWSSVDFQPTEVWNLSQGFLADSDAAKHQWKVTLLVLNHESGAKLYERDALALDFGSSGVNGPM